MCAPHVHILPHSTQLSGVLLPDDPTGSHRQTSHGLIAPSTCGQSHSSGHTTWPSDKRTSLHVYTCPNQEFMPQAHACLVPQHTNLSSLAGLCPSPGWGSGEAVFPPACPLALEPACCLPALCPCPGLILWISANSPSPTPTTTCREHSAQPSSTWG